MKYLIVFLFLPVLLFGQVGISQSLFKDVANDTIASITVPDSVFVRWSTNSDWQLLTQAQDDTTYVTVYDKVTEHDKIFILAGESYWTYANSLQFQIRATNTDTINSRWINTGGLDGAFTLVIRPDTSGTNTDYSKSFLMGK